MTKSMEHRVADPRILRFSSVSESAGQEQSSKIQKYLDSWTVEAAVVSAQTAQYV